MPLRFTNRRQFIAAASGICGLGCSTLLAAPPPPLMAGQIGTRHSHASGKLEAMRSLTNDYNVVGVVEADTKSRESAQRQKSYAGLPWLEEQALLADAAVQVVVVETTLEASTETARRVIAAGKHLHLDKPGGADHAAFRTMRLEAEACGLVVQMGYMLRHQPAFSLLFRAARAGWFGEILEITASMGKQADRGLRASLAAIPGNGMFELACHLVDAVVTLLGAPKKVTAFGVASQTPADPLLDHQLAVLEYPQALVTLRSNHNDPGGGPRRAFLVVGTQGSLEIAPLESGKCVLNLSKKRDEFAAGRQELTFTMPRGRYDEEFSALARWVRGTEKPVWTAEHDIIVHATALRAAGCEVK